MSEGLPDSVVVRRVPGTQIMPGAHVFMTRTLGLVVLRALTPAEVLAIRRHPECLRPVDPSRLVPHYKPSGPPPLTLLP